MLNTQLLRTSAKLVAQKLKTRGFDFDYEQYNNLEKQRKNLQIVTQELQNKRNNISKEIGILLAQKKDIKDLRAEMQNIAQDLANNEKNLAQILEQIEDIHLSLPNIPHDSVPIGKSEADNLEVRKVGDIPKFDFAVKSHDSLGQDLGQINFDAAAKITGSRFVVLTRDIAKLQRALTQYMLNTHVERHGYQEIYVPYIVNAKSLIATGQLPKFEEDLFKLSGEMQYYLTSTAEIPVTNMVRDEILSSKDLPIKYVCHTPCFRSEAGSYGRDTKGMIRQHQFEKVELVWITHPESSYDALESLLGHAEYILQSLELPYRVVALSTGDLGASSAKTYDLEVWLPSQNTYREISSCSNMEAFQAARLKARYKDLLTQETKLVHTLNGSGLAVGRTLVAILENYQQADGSILIPKVLQTYMGKEYI